MLTEAQYLAAIEAINADLPWYAKQKDTLEFRAMILKVYQVIIAAAHK